VGARLEGMDALWELRSIDATALTGSEIVERAAGVLGEATGAAVGPLVTLADRVVYDPGALVSEAEAAAAWAAERRLVRLAGRALRPGDKIRAYFRLARRADAGGRGRSPSRQRSRPAGPG
jgi:hypothetical protein